MFEYALEYGRTSPFESLINIVSRAKYFITDEDLNIRHLVYVLYGFNEFAK